DRLCGLGDPSPKLPRAGNQFANILDLSACPAMLEEVDVLQLRIKLLVVVVRPGRLDDLEKPVVTSGLELVGSAAMVEELVAFVVAPLGGGVVRGTHRQQGRAALEPSLDSFRPLLTETDLFRVLPDLDAIAEPLLQFLAQTLFERTDPFQAIFVSVAQEKV